MSPKVSPLEPERSGRHFICVLKMMFPLPLKIKRLTVPVFRFNDSPQLLQSLRVWWKEAGDGDSVAIFS